ncbi:hypothetical protein Tco_0302458 [Tanacetum coccineum]
MLIPTSNPHNRQIAQLCMNLGQDRQMQMVRGNEGNQFRQYVRQNVGNQNGYNAVHTVGNRVVQNTVQNLEIRYGVTTVEDWVIFLGTAQPDQEKGMLLIFKHSC